MCWDCFKKKALSSEGDDDDDEKTLSKKKKKKSPEEDESDESTAASKARKHYDYDQFFKKALPNPPQQLVFSQRLSTIDSNRVVNIINLPLRLQHNGKVKEINTPQEFAESMGFTFQRLLGKGGYGEVFLVYKHVLLEGESKVTTYRLACKTLHLTESNDKKSLRHIDQLRTELYVLQSLKDNCNFIIKYQEHYILRFRQDNQVKLHASIYMEFADGGTLMDVVKKAKKSKNGLLPIKLIRRYFSEMAQGLEFLHRNQIAHNDFKLDNVLLVSDPERPKVWHCKLSDMGMAQYCYKYGVGIIRSSKHWGTLTFMAPEILRCGLSGIEPVKYVPYKADIFSLGVSLYWMATGSSPFIFSGDTDEELCKVIDEMKQGIFNSKQLRKKLGSDKLINLLKGMIEFNPDKRLTIDAVLKHPWLNKK